jgi:hypothetical protein
MVDVSFHRVTSDGHSELAGDSMLAALHKITETCYGQMSKLKDVGQGTQKNEFLFCTLFLNSKGENRSTWETALTEQKIKDWREHDVRDFFCFPDLG